MGEAKRRKTALGENTVKKLASCRGFPLPKLNRKNLSNGLLAVPGLALSLQFSAG
jgi:hypothetical protein